MNLAAIGWLKAVCPTVFLAALPMTPARVVGQTLLPGLRAPLLETPPLPSVLRNEMTLDPNSAGPNIDDAELQELARGLKYEPGLMYEFVHDHIHFTPLWGEVKGPYMTWMDRSGNDFDQASLMIALLKQAAQYGSAHIAPVRMDSNAVESASEYGVAHRSAKWATIGDEPTGTELSF
jgi:hypothetical protein